MSNAGFATLQIIPSLRGFQGNLEKGLAGPMTSIGQSSGTKMVGGLKSKLAASAKSVIAPLAGGMALYKGYEFFKGAISEASTLNESINALNVSYGKHSEGVQALGREAATSLGLSNTEFNSLAVRFSAFSKTIAGPGGDVVKTLDTLTTRASDFASVMNLEVADAAQLFQSGLAGETEPLRRFGIDLSAAAVGAHAVKTGIAASADSMTEAQKVQARYSLLMQQTSQTQGDFANTSGELANQQRILSARWDDAKARIGTALLPAMKDVVGFVNREGIPAFERFADWFADDGIDGLRDFAGGATDLARDLRPLASSLLKTGRDALPVVIDGVRTGAKVVKSLADAFNSLPDGAQKLVLMGGGALYLNKKLGGTATSLPPVITGLGRTGAAADTATSRFGVLKGVLGKGLVAAAVLVGLEQLDEHLLNAQNSARDFATSVERLSMGLPTIVDFGMGIDDLRTALEQASQKDFASLFGIDTSDIPGLGWTGTTDEIKKLDAALASLAQRSPKEARAAFGQIKVEADRAGVGMRDLMKLFPEYRSLLAERRSSKASLIDLSALMNGMDGLRDYRAQLLKLPKSVLTKVASPGALTTRKEVIALGREFKGLSRRDIRVIMRARDFASADIRKVLRALGLLDKQHPKPKIGAEGQRAFREMELVGRGLHVIDKAKPKASLLADKGPAVNSTRDVIRWFGTYSRMHPSASLKLDTSAVTRGVQYANQMLNNINDETVFVRYEQVGGAHRNARGGYITGPGTGTSDSIPSWLSNGEYVVRAAAVQKYGVDMLHKINAQRFADGGPVGTVSTSAAPAAPSVFPSRVTLVVGDREFDAYVDTRADSRIAARRRHDARVSA